MSRRDRSAGSAAPRRAFVDSSGWVALISANDANHAAADGVFRKAIASRVRLVTTNLVVAEVHRFLLDRVGIAAASSALARIEGSSAVTIEFATREHHAMARSWLSKLADRVITYADAVSFSVMQAARCEVVIGFDADFVTARLHAMGPRLMDESAAVVPSPRCPSARPRPPSKASSSPAGAARGSSR